MQDGDLQSDVKFPIAGMFAIRYVDYFWENERLTSTMAEANAFKVSTIKYDEYAVVYNWSGPGLDRGNSIKSDQNIRMINSHVLEQGQGEGAQWWVFPRDGPPFDVF